MPIKSRTTTVEGTKGKKKKENKNPKEYTEQIKTRIINVFLFMSNFFFLKKSFLINVFLESLLSESFPSLGVIVHFTSIECPLTLR